MRSRWPFSGLVPILVILTAVFIGGVSPAVANSKYASLVIDANTGATIRARNADSPRYPASLTKIMTLYVLFGEIKAGRIKKSDRIRISPHAAAQPPSRLGLKAGDTITVDNAIRALVTKSANDVAAAVGEHVEDTEWKFAKRMTATAQSLGMNKTTFRNASGLPHKNQKTTARDMSKLGLAMMTDFPELYKMFRLTNFTWRGNTYRNHNRLLGKYKGTEGIKTGYIRASGYNLVASVRRGEKLAVGVVMGGKSGSSRDAHMRQILSESFPKLSARRSLPPRPKPVLISKATTKAASTPATPVRAATVPKKKAIEEGVVRLTMVATPPRSRELPLAEPISRETEYAAAVAPVVHPIRPTIARAAVMHSAPRPPVAVSSYRVAAAPQAAAAFAANNPGAEPVDPIEQLIAAAMAAPPIPGEQVRTGRLIVPVAGTVASAGENVNRPVSAVAASSTPHTPAPETIEIPDGYQIQVGAYATQGDAQRRLERAQQTAREHLAKAMGFTPSVEKTSGTIYRARFAGLDKTSAKRACSALKKKRIDCIVVAQ